MWEQCLAILCLWALGVKYIWGQGIALSLLIRAAHIGDKKIAAPPKTYLRGHRLLTTGNARLTRNPGFVVAANCDECTEHYHAESEAELQRLRCEIAGGCAQRESEENSRAVEKFAAGRDDRVARERSFDCVPRLLSGAGTRRGGREFRPRQVRGSVGSERV